MSLSPIVYELGLTIVALVAFVVWQTITLKQDMKRTREEEKERAERAGDAKSKSDTPVHG